MLIKSPRRFFLLKSTGLVFAPGGKRCVSLRRKWKFSRVQNFTHDSIVQEAEWCSVLMENWFISPSRNLFTMLFTNWIFTSGMYFIYICMCCITFQCAKESKGLWIYNDFCLIISSWKLFYKSNAKVNTYYLIIIFTLGWFTDIEQIYGQYKN